MKRYRNREVRVWSKDSIPFRKKIGERTLKTSSDQHSLIAIPEKGKNKGIFIKYFLRNLNKLNKFMVGTVKKEGSLKSTSAVLMLPKCTFNY